MLPPEIENRIEEIRVQVDQCGAELVDTRFSRRGAHGVITFLVDKPGGITLEECARINRHLGAFDWLAAVYGVEVNSPGLDRPLKTARDFARTEGQKLKVTWRLEDGRTRTETGTARLLDAGSIEFHASGTGAPFKISLESILKAVREIGFK